jgi:hypothetical protein
MTTPLDTLETMLAECDLDEDLAPGLAATLRSLDHLVGAPPEPSAELAAAVADRFGSRTDTQVLPAVVVPIRRGRRLAITAAVAVVAAVSSTGIAAANNKLPEPVQREIAEFSRHYLPFDFPAPNQQTPRQEQPRQEPKNEQSPEPVQPTPTVGDDDDHLDDHGGEVDRDDRVEPGDDRNITEDLEDNSGPGSDDSSHSGSDDSGSDDSGSDDSSGHGSDD